MTDYDPQLTPDQQSRMFALGFIREQFKGVLGVSDSIGLAEWVLSGGSSNTALAEETVAEQPQRYYEMLDNDGMNPRRYVIDAGLLSLLGGIAVYPIGSPPPAQAVVRVRSDTNGVVFSRQNPGGGALWRAERSYGGDDNLYRWEAINGHGEEGMPLTAKLINLKLLMDLSYSRALEVLGG